MQLHEAQGWYSSKKINYPIMEKKVMSEWSKLIPKPKSVFLRVKCSKCGNEQLVFSNAVNKITCNVCGDTLAEPSGGRAKIKGDVQAVLE